MGTFRQDTRLGKMVPLMKTDDYNDKSVTTEKLADKAITDKKVADDAISTSNIKDSSVTNQKVADGSITTEKLADNAVTSEKIAQGAVDSAQIEYDAVMNHHIDDGAVTADKLFDGCVQTEKLEDHAVTMEKLADGSVVNKKLAPDSVSATKIADQAVLVSKIANEVWEKLKSEYLRLDGRNFMKGNLDLSGHYLMDVAMMGYTLKGKNSSLSFDEDNCDLKFTGFNGLAFTFNNGNFSVDGESQSKGFKTIDRTNIGLLVNDGSVGLAMTDSDIDAITSQVFTNYVNND